MFPSKDDLMIWGFSKHEGSMRVWGMNAKCGVQITNLVILQVFGLN